MSVEKISNKFTIIFRCNSCPAAMAPEGTKQHVTFMHKSGALLLCISNSL